jgi:hypothetical protein
MQMMGPVPPMGPMQQHYKPPHQAPVYQPERPVAPQPQILPNDKDTLGELLYPKVQEKNPENASKITGMLLEMEIDQIHHIIQDPGQLDKWMAEAVKVLKTTPTGQPQ